MSQFYTFHGKKQPPRFFLADDYRITEADTNRNMLHYLNRHNYAEVHVISSGSATCNVNGKNYSLSAGDAILIPAGFFHAIDVPERRFHDAFQTDIEVDRVSVKNFPPQFIQALFERWAEKHENVINYLTFIVSELTENYDCIRESKLDDKFMISCFIENNYYRNVSLKDLASVLHLSEMHTQRLVKKHMGKSFGKCIREQRVVIAEYLMKHSDLSKDEIARYVGYGSYNGFWKAQKKEKKEEKEEKEED